MSDLLCYCFHYTEKDIQEDILKNGQSTILAYIAEQKKEGGCRCREVHPKGR